MACSSNAAKAACTSADQRAADTPTALSCNIPSKRQTQVWVHTRAAASCSTVDKAAGAASVTLDTLCLLHKDHTWAMTRCACTLAYAAVGQQT